MEQRHAIRQLDERVIGKIAAGEVVERPAFAIKELVENSIDAGATAVTVEIRDGGLEWFRVVDNGCGIVKSEIRMAFARHATSKLRREEDLASIHTLGFRGEALASIAAVARVELTTRTAQDESGVKALVEGGNFVSIEDAGCPEGTAIIVKDLFYNVPARKKFLKKPATEGGIISDFMMRLILARPDISFRFINGGKQVYRSAGNGNLKDAIFSVLGAQAVRNLTEVKGNAAGMMIEGYVGVGEAARSSRAMQTFVLNGRVIRNTVLSQAVEEGCRERVMIGKYPICALQITMPFEAVDVNVHPNKLEVRFADERAILDGLSRVVHDSFEIEPLRAAPKIALDETEESAEKPLPQKPAQVFAASPAMRPAAFTPPAPVFAHAPQPVLRDSEGTANRPSVVKIWADEKKDEPPVESRPASRIEPAAPAVPAAPDAPAKPEKKEPEQLSMPELETPKEKQRLPLRLIGVAWKEYIILEMGETLYLVDQHAAHERILYEKFNREKDTGVISQPLLAPMVVQLSHREYAILLENEELLRQAGFEIEDYGDRSVRVTAVPVVLGVPQVRDFFGEMADRISEYRTLQTKEMRRDALVKLACRKAVKAGDTLSMDEIETLVAQMLKTGAPPTCPHGRPLVVKLEKSELDKRFRRIV